MFDAWTTARYFKFTFISEKAILTFVDVKTIRTPRARLHLYPRDSMNEDEPQSQGHYVTKI